MTNYEDILREYEDKQRAEPGFDEVLAALQAMEAARSNRTLLYGLSDLTEQQRDKLLPVWHELGNGYRRKIMRDLVEFSEANIDVDYRTLGLLVLRDTDPVVRSTAIDLLWEDETLELMHALIVRARKDDSVEVRAAAASALGRFILLGELGDLPTKETLPAQDAMMMIWQDEQAPLDVRRRALEAIANCSHPNVPKAISAAYHSDYPLMRVSAVYAMGRSYDERWHDIVLEEIESSDPEMVYEAAKAAGELEITEAVPRLARLILDEDREILEVTVWSLGEIGGKEAVRVLEALMEKAEDEDDAVLMDAIEEALGNATLMQGLLGDMLHIDEDDIE